MKVTVLVETDCRTCEDCPTRPDCADCFVRLLQGSGGFRFEHVHVQVIATGNVYVGLERLEKDAPDDFVLEERQTVRGLR